MRTFALLDNGTLLETRAPYAKAIAALDAKPTWVDMVVRVDRTRYRHLSVRASEIRAVVEASNVEDASLALRGIA